LTRVDILFMFERTFNQKYIIIMSPRTKEQFELIRQSSKQKILDAALEVFAKYGYHSASVSTIAKKAGIAKGLLYNYFKSKEDVLYELMIGMIVPFVQEIMPLKSGQKMTKKDMIGMINRTFDLIHKKPDYWKLYIGVYIQPDVMPKINDKVWEVFGPMMSVLTDYFISKKKKNPYAVMRYFAAILDGVQLHVMLDPENFPVEQVKELLIKQFA
jgi:AcrR family transcriptional regulator